MAERLLLLAAEQRLLTRILAMTSGNVTGERRTFLKQLHVVREFGAKIGPHGARQTVLTMTLRNPAADEVLENSQNLAQTKGAHTKVTFAVTQSR